MFSSIECQNQILRNFWVLFRQMYVHVPYSKYYWIPLSNLEMLIALKQRVKHWGISTISILWYFCILWYQLILSKQLEVLSEMGRHSHSFFSKCQIHFPNCVTMCPQLQVINFVWKAARLSWQPSDRLCQAISLCHPTLEAEEASKLSWFESYLYFDFLLY